MSFWGEFGRYIFSYNLSFWEDFWDQNRPKMSLLMSFWEDFDRYIFFLQSVIFERFQHFNIYMSFWGDLGVKIKNNET